MGEQPRAVASPIAPPLYVLSDDQVERAVALLTLARRSRRAKEERDGHPGAEVDGGDPL